MNYVVTSEKTLEEVVFRVYGLSALTADVIKAMPKLSFLPRRLKPGTILELPEINIDPPPVKIQRLWD